MQRIINLIVRFKELVIFIALVVISLSIISMGDVSRLNGFRTVVIASVGWMQEIFAWIPNPGALEAENNALRDLNLQLSAEVTRMRNALIENKRLRALLELQEKSKREYISAEVIGRSSVEMRNYLTLDRGSESGIERQMAVRTAQGLVGVVAGVSENFSLIELITNRHIKIASKIERNDISGILMWGGAENFYLQNIPESYDVVVGDVVLTSNYSNKYPANIPIGRIRSIEKDRESLFLQVRVDPFADFKALSEVFIVKSISDPERKKLIDEMEERLRARKGD